MTIEHPAATAAMPATGPAPYSPPMLLLSLLALGVMILLALLPAISNDGDIGWHVATGRWIAAHGQVPTTDPFSLTFGGQPWVAHEWLSELLLAGAAAIGDWIGLALLVGLAVGALIMVMGLEIGRWLSGPHTLIVLLLVVVVLLPFVFARPHVLAWVPLAMWTILLMRAREANRTPPLSALLLMLVWANMHGSFIMGLALTGAFALEALLAAKDRLAVLRAWLIFGVAALLISLVTPSGIEGLLFPFKVSALKIDDVIIEWRPTVVAKMPGLQVFLFVSLFTLLYRGVKMPLVRLLLLCGLMFMAFASARHQPLLAILGSLVVAAPLGVTFPIVARGKPAPRGALAGVAAAALLFATLLLANPAARPETPSHPAAIIAALPPELRTQPVLNGYGLGGSLILAGIKPFIDGRADMYGDDFAFQHLTIVNGDAAAFDKAVARWGITWTILPPDNVLVSVLDGSPHWRRLAADKFAVVHVRRGAAPASAAPPASAIKTPRAG